VFHLGEKVSAIEAGRVKLAGGGTVDADLVIVGIGVTPVTDFIRSSGIALDRGVAVNEYLETNVPGVYAAGDIARWPDLHTGERIRVEHWVVAERQGQVAARNLLGRRERFDAVPFFWSAHYDTTINYVGHAAGTDEIDVAGDLAAGDCTATFRRDGRTLAVATIGRDRESLRAEVALEKRSQAAGV
jgi:NADPH-dependent 2,4-dienoyl-CoA reductase/sulfur reductase-like enzyme